MSPTLIIKKKSFALSLIACLTGASIYAENVENQREESAAILAKALAGIPHNEKLNDAPLQYLSVFEVQGDALTSKAIREPGTGLLGVAGWARLKQLIPTLYRQEIVQLNVMSGRRLAGSFNGDGQNDIGRPGFSFSIARYQLEEEPGLYAPHSPPIPRRGALDWTIVHEMGHYICLDRTQFDRPDNLIEMFSWDFDGDGTPPRREAPDDYPADGSPSLTGHFVTSYAERAGGDEEVCETFTTYLLIPQLPTNDSLAARKIHWFHQQPGMPELRKHIQTLNKKIQEND